MISRDLSKHCSLCGHPYSDHKVILSHIQIGYPHGALIISCRNHEWDPETKRVTGKCQCNSGFKSKVIIETTHREEHR